MEGTRGVRYLAYLFLIQTELARDDGGTGRVYFLEQIGVYIEYVAIYAGEGSGDANPPCLIEGGGKIMKIYSAV